MQYKQLLDNCIYSKGRIIMYYLLELSSDIVTSGGCLPKNAAIFTIFFILAFITSNFWKYFVTMVT